MRKIFILVACLAGVSLAFGQSSRGAGGEGLILVATTVKGFVLASDSKAPKIFPVGRHGAILFAGATSIQDSVDRPVRRQLNVVRIAKAWLDAHPDADLPTADHEIYGGVSQALTTFFAQGDPGSEAGHYKFTIIFVGFVEGKAVVMTTAYGIPLRGMVPRTQTASEEAKPGWISMFGEGGVAERLLRGDRGLLEKFQAEPGPVKYHTHREEMTDSDYLSLFGTILRSSESAEGKQAHHGLGPVAPPNRFATLTVKDGLKVRKGPANRPISDLARKRATAPARDITPAGNLTEPSVVPEARLSTR